MELSLSEKKQIIKNHLLSVFQKNGFFNKPKFLLEKTLFFIKEDAFIQSIFDSIPSSSKKQKKEIKINFPNDEKDKEVEELLSDYLLFLPNFNFISSFTVRNNDVFYEFIRNKLIKGKSIEIEILSFVDIFSNKILNLYSQQKKANDDNIFYNIQNLRSLISRRIRANDNILMKKTLLKKNSFEDKSCFSIEVLGFHQESESIGKNYNKNNLNTLHSSHSLSYTPYKENREYNIKLIIEEIDNDFNISRTVFKTLSNKTLFIHENSFHSISITETVDKKDVSFSEFYIHSFDIDQLKDYLLKGSEVKFIKRQFLTNQNLQDLINTNNNEGLINTPSIINRKYLNKENLNKSGYLGKLSNFSIQKNNENENEDEKISFSQTSKSVKSVKAIVGLNDLNQSNLSKVSKNNSSKINQQNKSMLSNTNSKTYEDINVNLTINNSIKKEKKNANDDSVSSPFKMNKLKLIPQINSEFDYSTNCSGCNIINFYIQISQNSTKEIIEQSSNSFLELILNNTDNIMTDSDTLQLDNKISAVLQNEEAKELKLIRKICLNVKLSLSLEVKQSILRRIEEYFNDNLEKIKYFDEIFNKINSPNMFSGLKDILDGFNNCSRREACCQGCAIY